MITDYHGDQQAYVEAKLRAVHMVRSGGVVIVNAEDSYADRFMVAARQRGCHVLDLGFDHGSVRLQRDQNHWRLRSPYADTL